MKTIQLFLFLLVLVGCQKKVSRAPVVRVSPDSFNFTKIFDTAYDGMELGLTGYIRIGDTIDYSYKKESFDYTVKQPEEVTSYTLYLTERRNQFIDPSCVKLDFIANSAMYHIQPIPSEFVESDLKITGSTLDTAVIHAGDRIGVSGKFYISPNSIRALVYSIGKLPDTVVWDYSRLGAVDVIDKPVDSLIGRLVSVRGLIQLPDSTLDGNFTTFLVEAGKMHVKIPVDIAYGKKAGQVEPLPAGYLMRDLRVHNDHNGLVKVTKPLIVYGIWNGQTIRSESISNTE